MLDAERYSTYNFYVAQIRSDYYHPMASGCDHCLALRRPKPSSVRERNGGGDARGHNINLVSLSRAPRQAAALRLLRRRRIRLHAPKWMNWPNRPVLAYGAARRGHESTDEVAILAPLPRAQTTLNAQSVAVDAIRSRLAHSRRTLWTA